jgi:hypothetical protein
MTKTIEELRQDYLTLSAEENGGVPRDSNVDIKLHAVAWKIGYRQTPATRAAHLLVAAEESQWTD